MNSLKTIISLTAIISIVLLAAPVTAGTFDPSYRGDDNSVHAIFDWVSNDQTDWNTTLFETGPSIYPMENIQPSAFDDGNNITIQLPNFIDELPMKQMRMVIFFDGAVQADQFDIHVVAVDSQEGTQWQIVGGSTGNLNVHYVDFEIYPNPDWEQIRIFGNDSANIVPGNLLRIEVDTVSVPEPATMGLLAMGSLALLRRRKR